MLMISPKNQPHIGRFLDCVEFCHQFGEKRLPGFVKQGPPGFLAILRMHDFHAVRPLFRPIVRDFKGAAVLTEPYPSFSAAVLKAMSSSQVAVGVSRAGWPGARVFRPIRANGL